MNRYEFLTQLEEQLRGFVSNQEVRESVQYYQGYIEEEMRKGFTEEEVRQLESYLQRILNNLQGGFDHE